MAITLTGDNGFLLKKALSSLETAFVDTNSDLALERLDGEESSADRMQEAIQGMPFLSPKKMVVLREPSKQKAFTERLADLLEDIPETTELVIVEPKLDKRLSYYKTLKAKTEFREFKELDARGLADWAVQYAKEQGGKLSSVDAKLLIDRLGINQQLLQNELDKLLAYDEHITKDSILALTELLPQSTVFELLDAAFAGNTRRAIDLYHEQRSLKIEPQAIIGMLAWQLHILAVVKASGSRSAGEIAQSSKVNPYVVQKNQSLVRRLSMPQLAQMVTELLRIDIALKRSSIDADEALELYLIKISV
jgi:DNA polymerase III subunit delta